MNDRSHRIVTLEGLVVGVLLVAGIGLRIGLLAWPPLTPVEAAAALSAARSTPVASALDPSSGPADEPAYASMTALLFGVLEPGDALARAVPAAAGIALLALPLALRRRQGPALTVLTMSLLAISPALVMTARTAGGGALAIAALSFCFALLMRDELAGRARTAWIAILFALAMAAGPSALNGLLGLGLGLAIHRLLSRSAEGAWQSLRALPWSAGRELVLFIALLAVFSTALGTRLDGVAGLASSLGAWLEGWTRHGALTLGPALAGMFIYEPMIVAGAVYTVAAVRSRTRVNGSLAAWALGALLVLAAYPGRSVTEVAWCVVPLAFLAAQAIEDVVERTVRADHKPILFSLIGILLLLSVFAYLQLSAYVRGIGLGAAFDPALGLGLALGALVLGAVVAGLFGLGWSWALPANAAGVVGAALLAAGTVSALWSLNYLPSAASARELWRPQATTIEARLLHETVRGVSLGQTGTENSLALRPEDVASTGVAWALREFPLDAPEGALASDQPAVILRRVDGQDRLLAADYVGQTFSIGETRAWGGVLPSGLLHWLVLRDSVTTPEQWLLLVRADVAGFGESPAQPIPEDAGG